MFESLSTKLGEVFDRLRRRGALSEEDVNVALREVRVALLEADVALPVVKDFITAVRERAIGQAIRDLESSGKARRDEIVIATKAGYLAFDGAYPPNPREYFLEYALAKIYRRVFASGGGARDDCEFYDSHLYERFCGTRGVRKRDSRRRFAGVREALSSGLV